MYPGKGPLVVQITSDGQTVRFSDGGGLLLYLESQGMDLSMDPVISKTVFHAIKETPGCGAATGQVYLDSTPDQVGVDLWRFLQIVRRTHRHSSLEVQGCAWFSSPAPETPATRIGTGPRSDAGRR